MKYRDILGFSKSKKKIIKEKSKPKKTVLDGVKQELNEWHHNPPTEKRWTKSNYNTGLTEFEEQGGKDVIKEVGMASDIKKYTKAIDKDMDRLTDTVRELKNILMKNGAKKEAQELGSIYATSVGRFHKFIKIKFIKMIRKLI